MTLGRVYPLEQASWLQTAMLERARGDLTVPVRHVVVDRERERIALARGQRWSAPYF